MTEETKRRNHQEWKPLSPCQPPSQIEFEEVGIGWKSRTKAIHEAHMGSQVKEQGQRRPKRHILWINPKSPGDLHRKHFVQPVLPSKYKN